MPLSRTSLKSFEYEGGNEAREYRQVLTRAISSSSFTIEYLIDTRRGSRSDVGQTFGVFIKPGREAKARYGIDREVLVWCSTYPSFSARDTNKIDELKKEYGTRLSSMFTVLVTKYPREDKSSLEVESGSSQTMVHVTFDDLRTSHFDDLLSSTLFARDPFDFSGAVVKSADFFGRREQIDEVVAEIESGTSQIGIFGLRKAGKTSLLNRLYEKLQNSARVYVAKMDLQWTVAINDSPEYTAWALGENIHAAHKDIRRLGSFKLFGNYSTFAEIENSAALWEWFAHDMRRLSDSASRPVCLLIDEIERMYEGSEAGFVRFWRILRGLDQQAPGRLRIIIGGTSPQCVEKGHVGDLDNPMFEYLKVKYLGPLSKGDAGEMLSALGRLSGIAFDETALARSYESTGGHPALVRALGSAIHSSRKRGTVVANIDAKHVRESSDLIQQHSESLIDQMLASLAAQYPDEHELLLDLAVGRMHAFQAFAREFPGEYRRLVNYGLVSEGETPGVHIGLLQSRIQRRQNRPAAASRTSALSSGDFVGDWKVLEAVSSGGFAEVYRVSAEGEKDRALKVFTSANAAAVAREVDVLREFQHQNIVRFDELLTTTAGQPCILMELLDGRLLSDYCNADSRPTPGDWFKWLMRLLDALAELHPAAIAPVSTEMTIEQYTLWNHSKQGYVHRDVKPENIILVEGRGPVLFDFNISSKVGDTVRTVSATPGYIDSLDVRWGSEVDLYALGVTFAEVGAGARCRDSSLEELITALRRHQGDRAAEAVLLLTGPTPKKTTTREVSVLIRKLSAGASINH